MKALSLLKFESDEAALLTEPVSAPSPSLNDPYFSIIPAVLFLEEEMCFISSSILG